MSDFVESLRSALLTEDGSLSAQLVVWSVILGFIIAMVVIFYNKRLIGSFVRAVIAGKAYDEYTAKTVAELGQAENIFALNAYRRGGALARVVSSVDSQDGEKKYYIAEDNLIRAKKQYDDRGASPMWLFVSIAALILVGFAIMLLLSLI